MEIELTAAAMQKDIEQLKHAHETARAATCPHRVDIALAAQTAASIKELREAVVELRINYARIAAVAGLSGGGGAAIIELIRYLAGSG